MSEVTSAPDIGALEIPTDAWTQPFWAAAAKRQLLLPRCADCGGHRWPPGPFCPACQSQAVQWVEPGRARIYSYTVLHEPSGPDGRPARMIAPALVEFTGADHVRLLAAIVDTALDDIRVGAELTVQWARAANAVVPVFRVT